MAIYRCEVKTFTRAAGQSAVAAAAYRARAKIENEATGNIENYTRRKGLVHSEILLPAGAPEWANDQKTLWNQVEKSETRRNSTVAREVLVSLPHELNDEQRQALSHDISKNLVDRFGMAVQYSIHRPDKESSLNHHVHILASTRKLTADGFTEKTRELDDRKSGAVDEVRSMVSTTINEHLAKAGLNITVSHKSTLDQQTEAAGKGDIRAAVHLSREPTIRVGHGPRSDRRAEVNEQIKDRNIEGQRQFIDLLKNAADPIICRQQATAYIEKKNSSSTFNVQPFKDAAPAMATAGADASANFGAASGGMDGSVEATIGQIDNLEAQLVRMSAATIPHIAAQRASLKQQIENLKRTLAVQLAQKAKQKTSAAGAVSGIDMPPRMTPAPPQPPASPIPTMKPPWVRKMEEEMRAKKKRLTP